MELIDQVIDAWHIHSRITFYLLDAIPEETLVCGSGHSSYWLLAVRF